MASVPEDIRAIVREAPFRASNLVEPHQPMLRKASFVTIANALAQEPVNDKTVVWIYAILARFREIVDRELGDKLDVCSRIHDLFSNIDWAEVRLVPNLFAEMLHILVSLSGVDTLKVSLLALCVQSYDSFTNSNVLTLAHILLAKYSARDHHRFAIPLVYTMRTTLDTSISPVSGRDLNSYFTTASQILVALCDYELAAVYASTSVVFAFDNSTLATSVGLANGLQMIVGAELFVLPHEVLEKNLKQAVAQVQNTWKPLHAAFLGDSVEAVNKELNKLDLYFKTYRLDFLKDRLLLAYREHRLKSALEVIQRCHVQDVLPDVSPETLHEIVTDSQLCKVSTDEPFILERDGDFGKTINASYIWLSRVADITASIVGNESFSPAETIENDLDEQEDYEMEDYSD